MRRVAFYFLISGFFLLSVQAGWAAVLILQDGTRLTGEILNPDDSPRREYRIKTEAGEELTIPIDRVQKVIAPKAAEAEYEKIKSSYPDTPEGHWQLSQWCREHRLNAQREFHLRRILELDPEHAEARRALGYTKIDGQWFTQTEIMTKRGYVKYKGQWKTPQEIALAEEKRKAEAAEAEWSKKIRRWRTWLDGSREQQARENFAQINDPAAVRALASALEEEKSVPVRLLYVETLAQIDSKDAALELAATSIFDPDEEVRQRCLDRLEKKKYPQVSAYYVEKLKHKENWVVNRAALGLERLQDPTTIEPLIEALITVHKYTIHKAGGDNSTSATFGNTPGAGGLSVGGGPKVIKNNVSNQPVLDALTKLTGKNFGFDKQAWREWLSENQKKAAESLDARRGK